MDSTERAYNLFWGYCRSGNLDAVSKMAAYVPDINRRDASRGFTALHFAVEGNFPDVADALINSGAFVDALTVLEGETPLHVACRGGAASAVALLLRAGAATEAANKVGQSAADVAATPAIRAMVETSATNSRLIMKARTTADSAIARPRTPKGPGSAPSTPRASTPKASTPKASTPTASTPSAATTRAFAPAIVIPPIGQSHNKPLPSKAEPHPERARSAESADYTISYSGEVSDVPLVPLVREKHPPQPVPQRDAPPAPHGSASYGYYYEYSDDEPCSAAPPMPAPQQAPIARLEPPPQGRAPARQASGELAPAHRSARTTSRSERSLTGTGESDTESARVVPEGVAASESPPQPSAERLQVAPRSQPSRSVAGAGVGSPKSPPARSREEREESSDVISPLTRPAAALPREGPSDDWYLVSLRDREDNASRKYKNNYIRTAKYTILTFLPLNLFEQFRRFSNIYFLLSVIISFIPNVSPFSPVTTLVPLLFVVFVTLIKDGIEDFQRHKGDKKANSAEYPVSRYNEDSKKFEVETIQSAEIVVGDIVHIEKEREFPADLVLVGTTGADGVCYIETANLDGETNLKRRAAPEALIKVKDDKAVHKLAGSIACEAPTARLYKFTGNISLEGKRDEPLSADNMLLRGSVLRNTKMAYGVVVYAGADTKMMKNLRTVTSKFSRAQKKLNYMVLGIFALNMVVIFVSAGLATAFQKSTGVNLWYLGDLAANSEAYTFGTSLGTYFVAFTYLIPISLFVTIEIVRVAQALFMSWDKTMASDPDNIKETGMSARNSNMNEELGSIQHVFSDKTGTLTRNVMILALWSINGSLVDQRIEPDGVENLRAGETDDPVTRFLRCVALCNTVVPDRDKDDNIKYDAESPDEAALVQSTADAGVKFTARQASKLLLEVDGEEEEYEIMASLGFSSDRKRMSVIARFPDGTIWLICKGADVKILERLRADEEIRDITMEHLGEAAKEGLRTLMLGVREISQKEFDKWNDKFRDAQTATNNREEKVEAVEELIEVDLELLGATAVEDKLQDDVPFTLQYMLLAGLHVWVLTGDKMETAETIGYSSSLLKEGVDLTKLIADSADELKGLIDEQKERILQRIEDSKNDGDEPLTEADFALIIDGSTLEHALQELQDEFLELAGLCQAVICCRVTPLQKAQVVMMVKDKTGRVCLAVGDGANDVSMIQAAHVGVGIVGKEGTQAVRASDYALHEFKFLAPLITVHGRHSLVRLGLLIQYSFYKNLTFILPMFFFGFYSGWSGQIVYDQILLTTFNILWASLPPLIIGIWERDLSRDTIMAEPRLFSALQKQDVFSVKTLFVWIANAIYHGTVVYFVVFIGATYNGNDEIFSYSGLAGGFWVTATMASSSGVFVVLLKAALWMKWWTPFHLLAISLSMVGYIVFMAIYFSIDSTSTSGIYGTLPILYATPVYYLIVALVVVICLLPDFTILFIRRWFFPAPWMVMREREKVSRKRKLTVREDTAWTEAETTA